MRQRSRNRDVTGVVQPHSPRHGRLRPALSRLAHLAGWCAISATSAFAQSGVLAHSGGRPITFEDFSAMGAVSDPQVSPDGQRVLYAVRTTDLAGNARTTVTYVIPVAGGAPKQFPDDTTRASEARWAPAGPMVAYVSHGQLWVAAPDGSGRRQLTTMNGGADGPVWSPDGSRIAFTSAVYPGCSDDACNADRAKADELNPVKAHVADHLLYRHWNRWDSGTRSHLFVIAASGGPPADLIPAAAYDVPPPPFAGSEAYTWAPAGDEIAYTAKDQQAADAWTTDLNLYTVPAAGGQPVVITASNRGADQNPVYSPDGRYIAYASQARPGFESDRWRLMFYDRRSHESREILPNWDRNADGYLFTADGRGMILSTTDASRDKFYHLSIANGAVVGRPVPLPGSHNNSAPSLSGQSHVAPAKNPGPAVMVWMRDAAEAPAEVYAASVMGAAVSNVRQLTHVNDALLAQLRLNPAEDYWFHGAGGDSVQGFIIKPPQWEPGKRYPAVLLIHGGPEGAWLDNWHSRWNYQLFAAPGFAVIVINPRGSTGYGQKFVDGVPKDWGGKAYTDLMDGVDAALVRAPWIDPARVGAAGGSYGGYMVNWIAGHTDRFKALVSHAGPFNLENMYGATEELWFPEWEYGGPFWDSTAMATQYRRFSPHLFASHFVTPTLVINGELDYRVPYTEGLSMFTALQRQGVASKLIVFPDEGHWIGKPQNQRLWWSEVQGWLEKYLLTADAKAER
ncbi:MAG: alpha/beta fold hydrolase [Gemmatimonadales bacterium]